MILSPSIFFDVLLPEPEITDSTTLPPQVFSEQTLDLSRALHAMAGHSVSALGLQLELYRKRMADEAMVTPLDSFPRAAELLDILRAGQEFNGEGIYLGSVIWRLARGLPEATVHLEGFERIPLGSLGQAETLLHCAREGLLSAARAGADEVWLRLRQSNERISLEAEDNGCCSRGRPAHELHGLRTRIDALEGKLRVEDHHQHGWKLVASLPRGALPR